MHLKLNKGLNMEHIRSLTNSKTAKISFPLQAITTKRNVQTTPQKNILNFITQSSKKLHYDKMKADLSALTVNNLKKQLRQYNLKVSGKKSELVTRLSNFHVEQGNNVSSNIIQEKLIEKEKLSNRMLNEATKNPILNKINNNPFSTKLIQVSKDGHSSSKSNKKMPPQQIKIVKLNQKLPLVKPITKKNKVPKKTPSFNKANEMNANVTNLNNKPALKPIENGTEKPLPSAEQGNSKLEQSYELKHLPNYSLSRRDITFLISFMSFSVLWLMFGV